jgi:HD-GYP domain-containing protein (c-di-GMP phosphodiesterase class II)
MEISERLENLPSEVKFPDNLKEKISYDVDSKLLIFKGVMSEDEKNELLGISQEDSYRKSIGALFQRSQITKKREKKVKLSIRGSRDILEREKEGTAPTAPKENIQLKGLNLPEREEPPKERLRFSTLGQRIQEQSKQTDAGQKSEAEEKATPQVRVTKELKDEWKEAQTFYHEFVVLAQEVFDKIKEGQHFEIERVRNAIEKLIDNLTLGNESIVRLAAISDESYSQFASNAVNVTVISIKIGVSLHYNKSSLMELGMISFLRDIGLVLLSHIIEQPRKLKTSEYEEVKKHPLYTERFMEGLGIKNDVFKQVVLQHHEREDGSGYPDKLKGEAIHEYAKIIAVAEAYESLTHNRPVRAGLPPHTAMREILEEGVAFFGHRVTKAFIREFGVYPVGSAVELNTGEKARVIAVHKDFPLRPVVQLMADAEGKPMSKILNLLEKPQLFIKRPVEEGKR